MTVDELSSAAAQLYARWIRDLSRILTSRNSGPRGWSTLLLNTPEGISVHAGDPTANGPVLRLSANAAPEEIAAMRKRATQEAGKDHKKILLRLSASDIVDRTIQIPAAASDLVEPLLRNQMERIVPWPVEETHYGYQIVGANADSPDQLDIYVAATTRKIVDNALLRAYALGLKPYAVDFASEPKATTGIELLSLEADALKQTEQVLHIVLMVLLAASVAMGSFGFYLAFDHMSRNDDLEVKIIASKSQVEEITKLNDENTRLKEQREHLTKRKITEPPAFLLFEAMSRALPDSAYLTEFEIHGRETRIVGKSDDPTALITKLEDSPHFEDVRFSAPTTRQEGDSVGTFSIVGRAEGGANLEDQP
ncbi:PilN domain-containing protein [Hyphomicrobium facile]|uniref:General secretion pathway protein L n=1 Tax=Hyphomicrobium facile TaxID=51670 RepID=A0A1I7N4S4_9HYPH|nr:PilN domain-containing protein [Hyphomicrobium facile]SFV29583.1 general secretion pathway protein L [Hyphomicrobium facile]